jgi:predicted phosphodiesterase
MSVGIVTDLHLGNKSTRKSGQSIVYPRRALAYFDRAVGEMKAKGVDLVVSLGDQTQDGGKKYYKQLKKVEAKYGIKTIWVFGNHGHSSDKVLGPANQTYEKDGITFVVLDTSQCSKQQLNAGCLPKSQIDYLNAHKGLNTIVLQHIPPLFENTCEIRGDFSEERGMPVWSGHFHKSMRCGDVRVFPALTEHKKLNYSIIEL